MKPQRRARPRPPAATAIRRQTDPRRLLHEFLQDAGLRTFRVIPDPVYRRWSISAIHCTVDGGWKTFRVHVDRDTLTAALTDPAVRRRLVIRLGTALAPCDRLDNPGATT